MFHTPRNPFLETGAVQTFEDEALVIIAGRIAAMGGLRRDSRSTPARCSLGSPRRILASRSGGYANPLSPTPCTRWILAAILTLGDAASIREVRIGGRIVFSNCHDH
jgi:hypothetical protein